MWPVPSTATPIRPRFWLADWLPAVLDADLSDWVRCVVAPATSLMASAYSFIWPAVPVLLEIGRESVRSRDSDEDLLNEAALVAEASLPPERQLGLSL